MKFGGNSAGYTYLTNSPLVERALFTNGSTLRLSVTNVYDLLNRLSIKPGQAHQDALPENSTKKLFLNMVAGEFVCYVFAFSRQNL